MTPAAQPNWRILWESFSVAAFAGAFVVGWLRWRMHRYNKFAPPTGEQRPEKAPHPRDAGPGPVLDGTYRYSLTIVRREWGRRWPFWKVESAASEPSGKLHLKHSSVIELDVPKAPKNTIERRLYRACFEGDDKPLKFWRVGEVKGRDETKFLDGWNRIGLSSELTALGTNWSFKDNWISNVTVGGTVLVTLLASSSTFGKVIGSSAKPALTAMAVAAAISTLCVGIGPLIVKIVGTDLAYTTALGMLLAAFVTLVGTVGQITAITWEVWASTSNQALQLGVACIGGAVGVIVLAYAEQTLWYYVKTGTLYVPAATSDTLTAAALIAAAIEGKPAPPITTASESAAAAANRTVLL